MFPALTLLVLAGRWTTAVSTTHTEIVWTDSGPIRGEEVTFEGINYKAFRGIPYAAPPVGDLRFRAPQPPQKWTEVMDTVSFGKLCLQPRLTQLSSEDCLTLNVYTPSIEKKSSRPVLVSIHGGFYNFGSSADKWFGPEFLIESNTVVVTINYRLGALGFLSTNTPDATGNWGMKDQVAALKWVQANIAQFGGDPKKVAIYGVSAGASCVHLHMFSPLSKGLFHRAIMASGTMGHSWVLKSPDEQERYSRNLARRLGASEDEIVDPKKRIEFLRGADPIKMAEIVFEVLDKKDSSNPMMTPRPFTPVIEAPGAEAAFLTEDPMELLVAGKFIKVPIMIGLTDLEGSLLYWDRPAESFTSEEKRNIEENVCRILPQPLQDEVIARRECSHIAQRMREVYFNGKGFDSSVLSFVHLWGDLFLSRDIYFAQRIHSQYADTDNPVYNYYFTLDGKWNTQKRRFKVPLPGASHADDISYVFFHRGFPQTPLPESSPEVITKKRMISFLTNFLKYGNTTPIISDLVPVRWVPSNAKEFSILVIGNDLKMEKELLKSRLDLWDELREKYGRSFASPITTIRKSVAPML